MQIHPAVAGVCPQQLGGHKQAPRPVRAAPVYYQAATMLGHLMRNSMFAVATAWGFTYLFSLGNVLSGQAPANQSLASFTAANTGWSCVITTISCIGAAAASLMPLHFASRPDKTPSWLTCVVLLVRRTYRSGVLCFLAGVGVSYGLGLGGPTVQRWKLHFYIGWWILNMYTMCVFAESHRMYQLETIEGQRTRGLEGRESLSKWQRIHSMYKRSMPMIASVDTAAVYVHGASQFHFETTTQVLLFSVGSMAMKLLLQEAAAHVVMQQARSQVHHMYTSITMPTVLIDTQVRILLLRANLATTRTSEHDDYRDHGGSSSSRDLQVYGSIALAVVEVVVRIAKVWWLRRQIHRRQIALSKNSTVAAANAAAVEDFQQWKNRLLAFHAAEAQADMYAEYIAIGCSMAIYYFYHAHAKYRMDGGAASTTYSFSSSSSPVFASSNAQIVAFQVVLELLIDYICCMIEITAGVPSRVPRGTSGFIAALVTSCAVVNVALSSAMYIVNGDG